MNTFFRKFRKQVKSALPESVLPFFRPDAYMNLFFYTKCLLRRKVDEIIFGKAMCLQAIEELEAPNLPYLYLPDTTLEEKLRVAGISFAAGRHAVFIDDCTLLQWIHSMWGGSNSKPLAIKIIKNKILSPDGTPYYVCGHASSLARRVRVKAIGSLFEKVCISNVLSLKGLAPRVYDLFRITLFDQEYYALLVERIDGDCVIGEEGEKFLNSFRKVLDEEGIRIIARKDNQDFLPPDFNGNMIKSAGCIKYIDIQNFMYKRSLKLSLTGLQDQPESIDGNDRLSRIPILRSRFKEHARYNRLERRNYRLLDDLFKRTGMTIDKKIVVDWAIDQGVFTQWAMGAGACWSTLICKKEEADHIARKLFRRGFSRFETCTKPASLKDSLSGNSIDFLYCGHRIDQFLNNLPESLIVKNLIVFSEATDKPLLEVLFFQQGDGAINYEKVAVSIFEEGGMTMYTLAPNSKK